MGDVEDKCLLCGGRVIFTSADNAIDIYPDIEDEDAILHYAKCSSCGAEYEIVQYSPDYPSERTMKEELTLRKEMLGEKDNDAAK